ncbi:relaxase/mobilization nuclease domain-containing protein [uncultured Roseivirga sp.]|uniref:relaxase/mobilization nuclease domain-containing protein n=1 Tax=uncultured Roseivirga sp. TaxID=543088 RepID=UPI0030D880A5|tara:strand:+ start:2215 stop:3627 length:1413 start_codon:yes stop_codon:yes gene_type:complete
MIPRIGARGFSFKGAGQYFFHDKKADTKERVAWTHTHNLATENPELAMKMMAYTAINRNRLKQDAGVPLTGRKGINQPVYTFSLGWSPDQEPTPEHMRSKALDALELLGLKHHEAVFVAHNDTAHPHVHAIVNLVNPENGKTLRPQNDRLKLSTWAEAYEKEYGKIYCEQRVINNEERRQGKKVKHRSYKVEKAATIQNLYNQAKDANDFQRILEDNGYTLASGDRRGFVLVDQAGKVSSLSRQLKGQRAKDIKERLSELKGLPLAQTLSEERQYFMRDQYETERQKKIVDAAIEAEEKRTEQKDTERQKGDQAKKKAQQKVTDDSFATKLDQVRQKEGKANRQALKKEQELRAFYKREAQQEKINTLKKQLEAAKTPEQKSKLKDQIDQEQRTLADIDQRMIEQNINPTAPAVRDFLKNDSEKKQILGNNLSQNTTLPTEKSDEQKREELRQQIRDSKKDRGQDFGLGR